MTATRAAIIAVSFYMICAIIAFGYVWNRQACQSVKNDSFLQEETFKICTGKRGAGATLGAMFWPLTLSVAVWEDVAAKKEIAP
jgi:NhaP-type Na+/H+ or K+/H+ antiporter